MYMILFVERIYIYHIHIYTYMDMIYIPQTQLASISAIPIKISMGFFIELDKLILYCIWKIKDPRHLRDP